MASRIVLVLALALGSNAFGPTIPECPSEQTRECFYDTDEPAEACGGVCTEAGASCLMTFGSGSSFMSIGGTCFATETDDAFIRPGHDAWLGRLTLASAEAADPRRRAAAVTT